MVLVFFWKAHHGLRYQVQEHVCLLHNTHTCNRDEGLWTPRFLACKPNFSLFSEHLDGGQATGTDNIRKKPKLVWDSRSRHLKTCNNNQQKKMALVMDHLDFNSYWEP